MWKQSPLVKTQKKSSKNHQNFVKKQKINKNFVNSTKWRQNTENLFIFVPRIFHFHEKNKHSYILPLLQVLLLLQMKRQKMADWPWWKMGKCFVQNVRKRIKLGKVVPNIIMKSINKMLKPLVRFAIEFSKTNEAEIITIANSTRFQPQPWRIL